METILLYILCGLVFLLTIGVILLGLQLRRGRPEFVLSRVEQIRRDVEEGQRALRQELADSQLASLRSLGGMLAESLGAGQEAQLRQLDEIGRGLRLGQTQLQQGVTAQLAQMEQRLASSALESENRLDGIRTSVERRLAHLQQENAQKLDEMRAVVDEKLQKTLQERMDQSFQLVSQRLEQVYRGLGEMQTLAVGVGDLKKVLTNVKSRGILGEIQLGAILEEILAPEQYDTNVVTKPGSKQYVEYAIKLPNEDGSHVYLPIDSKFPGDAYANLRDAYEEGDAERVQAAATVLVARLRAEAKDIRDKYVDPPHTTEFAILFLPFEGLYAEAVNRGMVELLQREYRVNIAGPSTMAALLNSLQMGFRTFAIQKRSSEVWQVLGAVKTEFDRFATVLQATQTRLEQAGSELDKLVGVRTRQIQRRLRAVTNLSPTQSLGGAQNPGGTPSAQLLSNPEEEPPFSEEEFCDSEEPVGAGRWGV